MPGSPLDFVRYPPVFPPGFVNRPVGTELAIYGEGPKCRCGFLGLSVPESHTLARSFCERFAGEAFGMKPLQ